MWAWRRLQEEWDDQAKDDAMEEEEEGGPSTAIMLAEDKKYYPSAEEVYGEGTETLVMEEDAQPLEVRAPQWDAGRIAGCEVLPQTGEICSNRESTA
jgi:hypothetical protein